MRANVYNKHTIPLSIILLIGFLFSLPMILGSTFYIDDLDRLAKGYGWNQDGRPFATLFMKVLSFGMPLTDLSPFTNILSVSLLLLSGYILSDMLNIKSTTEKITLSLLSISSPYLLQGLSYKWDSLTISLSILLTLIPFIFINRVIIFPLISALCLALSLLTYQASVVIYPIGFVILSLGVINKDLSFSFAILMKRFILSLILGGVFYKILSWILKTKYESSRGELFFNSHSPASVLKDNFLNIFSFFKPLLESAFGYFLLISLLLSICGLLMYYNKFRDSRVFLTPLLIASALIMVILLPLILENSPVAPRLFPGLSFAVIAVVYLVSKLNSKLSITIAVAITAFSFVVNASYFNALSSQYKYQEQIASEVFEGGFTPKGSVVIDGRAPLSLNASLTLKKYPFLDPILPVYLNSGWVWGGKFLYNHSYINPGQFIYTPGKAKERDAILNKKCSSPTVVQGRTYTLRLGDGYSIIDFNKEHCR